jgi:hypothetical protein
MAAHHIESTPAVKSMTASSVARTTEASGYLGSMSQNCDSSLTGILSTIGGTHANKNDCNL